MNASRRSQSACTAAGEPKAMAASSDIRYPLLVGNIGRRETRAVHPRDLPRVQALTGYPSGLIRIVTAPSPYRG